MLSLTLLLFLAYLLLLANYTYQWNRLAVFHPSIPKQNRRFSVLIPARNEQNNIGKLLEGIINQTYPKELIEIIVIDDGSTDQTAHIVQNHAAAKLIQLPQAEGSVGKKRALEAGIRSATHEWIITTDADSVPAAEWIATINAFLDRKETVCVVGPVTLSTSNGLVQAFQRYDHLMFQGITGAAVAAEQHALGNGANLCYRKDAFEAVGGFQGIDQVASGDDVLLIEKFIMQYPHQVRFLKSHNALVKTASCSTWKELWQQRLRWVSKAGNYKNIRLQLAQWITGGFNLVLLIQTPYCIINPSEWKATLAIWIFKAIMEWQLITSVATLYRTKKNLLVFLFLQPIHVCYLVAVGLLGQRSTYQWKGRTVR